MNNDIKFDVENLLNDHERAHSAFQIKYFIIGASGDNWHQYKQALREIENRYNNLYALEESLKRSSFFFKIKLFLLYFRPQTRKAFTKKIKIENKNIVKSISETKRELKEFLKIAKKLKSEIGDITEQRRWELEKKSWTAKGRRMAAIDRILTGGISHQTFEFILSLPLKSQNSILDKILPNDPERRLLIESLKD